MSDTREGTRASGRIGERIAGEFLRTRGYHIIDTNYAIRAGEVDIIAWHDKKYFGKTLCFIEVKYRSYRDGSAERSVDMRKYVRMLATARIYCAERNIASDQIPIQFEQVSIYGPVGACDIYHYEMIV